jgi:hypothetical protein
VRTLTRHAALALILLLLVSTVVVCAHTVEAHHDRHCAICAIARVSSEQPTPVLFLAALEASPGTLPPPPIPALPTPLRPIYSSRAPPSPTE